MDDIDDATFEDWVFEAIDMLPEQFRSRLGSVAIVIEERPSQAELERLGVHGLYGLYQGVPRSMLGADHSLTPSKITIYRQACMAYGRTPEGTRDSRDRHRPPRDRPPLRHQRRPLARAGRRRPRALSAGRAARMDARILLVEDDPSIREVTALGLQAAGFTVATAADGMAALEAWRAAPPDLVLLDVMLPRLDGLEVCRAIRRDSTVPIVMLTARADTIDVVVGLESGADDYLRKPFEMPELVARIRAALRRHDPEVVAARGGPGHPMAGVLRLGPLTIDEAGRTVERDGADIPLTRTEFDLLVELARHAGQVLDRDQLLDRVWGYDYLGDSRLVDVAIGRLRARVEVDPAEPKWILTVRGAGYKAARPG